MGWDAMGWRSLDENDRVSLLFVEVSLALPDPDVKILTKTHECWQQ